MDPLSKAQIVLVKAKLEVTVHKQLEEATKSQDVTKLTDALAKADDCKIVSSDAMVKTARTLLTTLQDAKIKLSNSTETVHRKVNSKGKEPVTDADIKALDDALKTALKVISNLGFAFYLNK